MGYDIEEVITLQRDSSSGMKHSQQDVNEHSGFSLTPVRGRVAIPKLNFQEGTRCWTILRFNFERETHCWAILRFNFQEEAHCWAILRFNFEEETHHRGILRINFEEKNCCWACPSQRQSSNPEVQIRGRNSFFSLPRPGIQRQDQSSTTRRNSITS